MYNYGGNQGWFTNCEHDETTGNYNLWIEEAGCGIMAANDLRLYMSNSRTIATFDEYKDLLFATYDAFPKHLVTARTVNDFGIITSYYVLSAPPSPYEVSSTLSNQYGYSNNLLNANSVDYSTMLNSIIASMNNHKPVILCERDALWIVGNEVVSVYNRIMHPDIGDPERLNSVGFPMYSSLTINTDGTGLSYTIDPYNVMTNHYVTITGVVVDNQADRCWLKVQTWGTVKYIDFNEFYYYQTPQFDTDTSESTIIVLG